MSFRKNSNGAISSFSGNVSKVLGVVSRVVQQPFVSASQGIRTQLRVATHGEFPSLEKFCDLRQYNQSLFYAGDVVDTYAQLQHTAIVPEYVHEHWTVLNPTWNKSFTMGFTIDQANGQYVCISVHKLAPAYKLLLRFSGIVMNYDTADDASVILRTIDAHALNVCTNSPTICYQMRYYSELPVLNAVNNCIANDDFFVMKSPSVIQLPRPVSSFPIANAIAGINDLHHYWIPAKVGSTFTYVKFSGVGTVVIDNMIFDSTDDITFVVPNVAKQAVSFIVSACTNTEMVINAYTVDTNQEDGFIIECVLTEELAKLRSKL